MLQQKNKQFSEGQKKIEKYVFSMNQMLGKGSYACVYLGRLLSDDTPAAVKVIDKRIFANQYNLKNIHCQIQIMKKMEHNNIVRLLDVYQTSNNMYIVTQFCEEGDLRNYLKKRKKLSQPQALNFLKDIMRGFQYMNQMDIMHRDLKPANILIQNGKLKISDFGFARNLDNGDSTILKSVVGTPLYMSPQILNHQQYTNKSDLWSIGLIYYEMLHGCTPWPASSQLQLISGIMSKPVLFEPSISERSKDFIKKCLKKRQDERMSWDQAFNHPLLLEGIGSTNIFRTRDQKQNRIRDQNRTPRQMMMLDFKEKDKLRSKSRSISAKKMSNLSNAISNLNKTPKSRAVLKNLDITPDRKSPWKN